MPPLYLLYSLYPLGLIFSLYVQHQVCLALLQCPLSWVSQSSILASLSSLLRTTRAWMVMSNGLLRSLSEERGGMSTLETCLRWDGPEERGAYGHDVFI